MSLWNLSKDIKILGKPKRNFHFHDQCTISKDHPKNLAELKQQKEAKDLRSNSQPILARR